MHPQASNIVEPTSCGEMPASQGEDIETEVSTQPERGFEVDFLTAGHAMSADSLQESEAWSAYFRSEKIVLKDATKIRSSVNEVPADIPQGPIPGDVTSLISKVSSACSNVHSITSF